VTTEATSLDRFLAARAATTRAPRSGPERRALVADLEDPDRWPDAAAALLAELGYRLLEPEPGAGDDSHLIVALREEPTRRHFDPESIDYYAPSDRVAALTTLDRAAAASSSFRERRALWGHVHVVDRVPVENRFLTFGGDLRLARVGPALTVVDLWSPAPIVRWGGHSQSTDRLAEAIGAFFGRLIVKVDYMPGAAERIDDLLPEVLYRAVLIDVLDREAQAVRRGAPETSLHAWLARAWHRAVADRQACTAAKSLLLELGLGSQSS
jgi:hypothetical protein